MCPAGCGAYAITAPIYGCSQQNVYGVASSVCVAALHQGFITDASGGLVQIASVKRQASAAVQVDSLTSLCATANNGVTPRALTDAGYSNQCQGFTVRKPTLVATDCAQNLTALGAFETIALVPGLSFAVSCPAGCALTTSAAVYGSSVSTCQSAEPLGAYRSASSVCRAAMHAGALTNEGGKFETRIVASSPAPLCASLNNGMGVDHGFNFHFEFTL